MREYTFPESTSPATGRVDGCCVTESVHARVRSTATALPELEVSNQDIIDAYEHQVAASTISKMQGVSKRRVAAHGIVDSDLLLLAARRCLDEAQITPDDLSKLIVTKFLGDRALPMTAALLQRKLGATVAMQAFDVDGGVHSFVQAMDVGVNGIACGEGPVLIVSGGAINRAISRTDPRVAFLFGDGAAAVLLVPSRTRHVLASYSFSNYDFVEQARGFEVRRSLSVDLSDAVEHRKMYELYSQEDYKRALDFVLEAMRVTVRALLQRAGRQLSDVDIFLVTENHGRMWSAIIEHLGIEAQKTLSLLAKYGNTMSAMLPLLLDEALRSGRLQPGGLVMLLSVGEGVSGGGMLISV